jgi:pyrimidine-nucleoside phosphorylase
MDMKSIIATRRDNKRHSEAELRWLAEGAANHTVPDYQIAAWLMAAYLNPLNDEETAWLTIAMAESGERIDLSGLPKPWVDKHSTGGVGDKTTIVVLPLLAACGLTLVKMSGRGLGVTGGTVDKLSSIPGFRLDLSPDEMKEQAGRIGLALTGQTPNLAPADKTLYAIRDATGAVSNIPLLVSSILSKKIAGGAETVVLDVKCGTGAFMQTTQEARLLARGLAQTAKLCGLNTRIVISEMNQPLGSAIGNALEVAEALEVLGGKGGRFTDLCVDLCAIALEASGVAADRKAAGDRVLQALSSGAALAKAYEWFQAQGAPEGFELPKAPVQRTVTAKDAGWVSRIDAETVGWAVISLGGGRQKKEDDIDPSVGVVLAAEVGQRVERGQELFTVHARTDADAQAAAGRVMSGLQVAPFEVPAVPPIIATL